MNQDPDILDRQVHHIARRYGVSLARARLLAAIAFAVGPRR